MPRSQNARLRAQVDDLTQRVIQNSTAAAENADLSRQLNYIRSPRFPQDFDPVTTEVTTRAPSEFQQQIGIAAGSTAGIRKNDPVVTADGLVGLVTQVAHDTAQVTLLTDPTLGVSALDQNTNATGMLSPGQGRGTLALGRVPKSQRLGAGDTIVTQGWHDVGDLSSNYPRGILIGYLSGASQSEVDLFWQAQVSPSVHFDSLRSVIGARPQEAVRPVSLLEPAKAAVLVFVASILQVTIFSGVEILGGTPDVVLLTLVAIALLRGSIYGAAAGFAAGLLVDTANLGTLGVTSLLLTLAGYWIGRYGETTGRDRAHAPFVSVAVATVLVQFGALILHYMLGDAVSARRVLLEALPPKVALNLLLTLPVYALTRRLLALAAQPEGVTEVRLLG